MANPPGGDTGPEADPHVHKTGNAAPVPGDDTESSDAGDTGPVAHLTDDAQTVVMSPAKPVPRYTAPGFDANKTEMITPVDDPKTEMIGATTASRPKTVGPETIAPRQERRSWGWVIALALVIAALAAVVVLVAVIISRTSEPKASQEDQVRTSIQQYDSAIQTGDLATLRSITCGDTRNGYVHYADDEWAQTYRKVSAAQQYPVVASIDEVAIDGDHAEANVTSFMAFAPQTRSSRSFDLQFRDDQWKICQAG